MPSHFDLVTLDAIDTERQAHFWRAALGLVEMEREDGSRWIVLGDAVSKQRRIGLQRIADLAISAALVAGDGKARLHLDLRCEPEEFAGEVLRLVGLGARELRPSRFESYGAIATLADPEGNLFDLCAYSSKFVTCALNEYM
jgi:catechol 2,3-dioxygenase-like lactoylglutathione lyase family enzyme